MTEQTIPLSNEPQEVAGMTHLDVAVQPVLNIIFRGLIAQFAQQGLPPGPMLLAIAKMSGLVTAGMASGGDLATNLRNRGELKKAFEAGVKLVPAIRLNGAQP